MDHLPVVEDAAFPPDEVICMVSDSWQYDRSGLTRFPLRIGFFFDKGIGKYSRKNFVLNTEKEKIVRSPAEKNAFIQSWLFFGVLTEVFATLEIPYNISDFVTLKNGCKFLSLRRLEKYMSTWEALEQDSDSATRDQRRASLDELLEMADILAAENLRRQNRYEAIWSLSSQCALSIQLLHEALRHAWGAIYMGTDNVVTTSGAGLLSDLPESRMRAAGWCPSEITMSQNRFSVTGRYFASRLRRRGRAMNHTSCTDTTCNASQIDNSTYVTQHSEVDCQCAHVEIDPQEVGLTLKQGKIPRFLIRPTDQSRDHLDLQMVDSGPYVAISHVWAHGLGNAKSNSLPLCQLRRIHGYVANLSKITGELYGHGAMAIWIDTLGVPLVQQTRKLALKLLPRTYAESTYCLIIDEELCQLSNKTTLEEFCLRTVFSTWARRLWTFQEGVLTWNKLYLQLKEGPSHFGSSIGRYETSLRSSLRLESVEEMKSTLPRVEDVTADVIVKLAEACTYRTTSRLSDQTFCLASIAGLDVHEIVEASTHEEKMRIFLLQIRDLPNRIIFRKGRKMSLDSFSWAPVSFLDPEKAQSFFGLDEDLAPSALCTPNGLQGRWPGFFLEFPSTVGPHIDAYYFKYGEFWVIIDSNGLDNYTPYAENTSVWQQLHALPHTCLLVHSLDLLQNLGLIVTAISSESGALTARSVLTVSATLVPITEVDIFNPSWLHPNRAIKIEGTPVAEDMVWNLI